MPQFQTIGLSYVVDLRNEVLASTKLLQKYEGIINYPQDRR